MFAGKHQCKLNFADNTRPRVRKVHSVNYDRETNVLLQNVIDYLTDQKVLGIPQELGIDVQSVSPCFLGRKQRAKNKPKNELTVKDVRLLANVTEMGKHLKMLPTRTN